MANKIGIIGSGIVGQQLGLGFLQLGYEVKIGTREPAKLSEWLSMAGPKASVGSFAEAAKFGDYISLCTKWTGTEAAIKMAGRDGFRGKIVMDVTNPLLFETEGKPPRMAFGFPESGGKAVQHWLPESNVVKAFNIITATKMTKPMYAEGNADLFIAGNDLGAKQWVTDNAKQWGWTVNDIGGIEESYLLEALAMLWIRYGFLNNHWTHGFKLMKG